MTKIDFKPTFIRIRKKFGRLAWSSLSRILVSKLDAANKTTNVKSAWTKVGFQYLKKKDSLQKLLNYIDRSSSSRRPLVKDIVPIWNECASVVLRKSDRDNYTLNGSDLLHLPLFGFSYLFSFFNIQINQCFLIYCLYNLTKIYFTFCK